MKKLIISAALLLTSGCSTINHNELMGNMQAPQPLDADKITVCRGSFLKVGMDQSLQQSFDPAVVAEKTFLAKSIEASYGDNCRPYSPK